MLILQVETVGDKYMAVSGLPTRCTNHTANIANLALDMIDIVQEVNARGRKMQVIVMSLKVSRCNHAYMELGLFKV